MLLFSWHIIFQVAIYLRNLSVLKEGGFIMILPKKHLDIYESIFGFGAFLLQQLENPMSTEELWECYRDAYHNHRYPVKFSFDQYIITLDYLFIIDAIEKDEEGVLAYAIA